MRNYNVVDIEDVSYLCKHKSWKMRPRIYWSKFSDTFNERIRFTLFGAYWQRLIIKILAPDIKTDILHVKGSFK